MKHIWLNLTERADPVFMQSALTTHDVPMEFLYTLPMVRKPIADMQGCLTMPLLNTVARAMRFQDEPDEAESDFFIMTHQP